MTDRHRVLGYREWSDHEPDTIRVGVELSASDGRAFVVCTMGSCTWLDPHQARDLARWVRVCSDVAYGFNEHGIERRYLEVSGHGRRWLGDDEFVLTCGCTVGCTFLDRGARVDVIALGPHLKEQT